MKMRRKYLHGLGLSAALCVSAAWQTHLWAAGPSGVNAAPGGFKYFVGIVGNPSVPDISWSDEELEQIKALGVNVVQLSIAWGGKPSNEVLNLEDLDAEQRAKFAFRIQQAKKHGLKTLAHFGIPRMLNYSPVRPACIMDVAVQKKYEALLGEFMTSFPEVDDVLVYTFDQQAWLCSEFGPCPRCSGLPLDERLPSFLNLLNETMQKSGRNTTLWWKPWELSKGQVVAILDKVKPAHFGLALNPSTSNEVYPFNDRSLSPTSGSSAWCAWPSSGISQCSVNLITRSINRSTRCRISSRGSSMSRCRDGRKWKASSASKSTTAFLRRHSR